jgi:hypothetical protein
MNDVTSRLAELGDALYEATRADLERSRSPVRKRRRLLIGLGVAAVLIPASAFATRELLSTDDVAQSLPAGTLALVGTNPTCETVIDQVEYRCVLDRPPGPDTHPGPGTGPGPEYVRVPRGKDRVRFRVDPGGPARGAAKDARPAGGTEDDGWLGAAEPTVDSTNHVNGGCRALDAAGMTWQCYIGEAAVEEEIISRQFLGERVQGPGVG